MIYEVNANLLEYPLDGFGQFSNCFLTMGAGLALQVKNKYPELYKADLLHGRKGDMSRLGKFSTVKCHDDKQGYNIYTQYQFGMEKRYTNYEAVYTGLFAVCNHAIQANVIRLGLPFGAGARLGGGSWRIIRAIIDDIFETSPIKLYICNYGA